MRIGTIGTGIIVEKFIEAVKENNDCTIVGCYSRKQETADAFTKKNKIKKYFISLKEMLQDEEIDTIYVASPNSLHFEHTKLALLAKKNVICEKPFTSNTSELEEVIALAIEKQVFLFEAITTIHLPNYKWVKDNLYKLGEIKMVQCNFSQYSRKYDEFKKGGTPNVFNPEFSGGALMDINLYNVHFVVGLFGVPKDVYYFANMNRNIDTSGVAILKYDEFISNCIGCKDTKSKNYMQIQGDKGYLLIEEEASKCLSVKLITHDGMITIAKQENLNAMFYEVKEFNEMIRNKDYKKCYDLLNYSKAVMQVIDKARASANIVFNADENKK